MAKKKPEVNKSQAIRAKIEVIPVAELATAKPKHVLDALEAEGWEIDNSMRSTTSRLLTIAKQNAAKPVQPENGRTGQASLEMAVEFVKLCGSFQAARTTLASLEQLVQSMTRS